VILFRWIKKLLYLTIYLRPNKKSRSIAFCVVRLRIGFSGTKKQFYSDLSAFQYSKFLGRCDFISFDKKTSKLANLFTPKQKLTFNCVSYGSLFNRIIGDQKAVLFGSICLPIFQILRTLWFCFVWWKNFYFMQFIYARTKTYFQLHFVWFVSELDFWGTKSSFIRIYPSSNIPNS
jgi:hypothetical protein